MPDTEDNNEKDESKIEELKRRLHSKSGVGSRDGDDGLSKGKKYKVKRRWGGGGKESEEGDSDNKVDPQSKGVGGGKSINMPDTSSKKSGSFLNKLLIFAVIFFVAAVGYAYFSLQGGFNEISPEKIDLEVSGPLTTPAGETLSFEISVSNGNAVPLKQTDLVVSYPEGTRSADDVEKEIQRYRQTLGDIRAQESKSHSVEAVLFGEEGEGKTITVQLEYRVPNSNAVYGKEKEYTVQIGTAPATLDVDMTNEVNSGQKIQPVVTVKANSERRVENLVLIAEYPFGFQFESADPSPISDNRIWDIGSLEPNQEKKIRIDGSITGQTDEERVFHFTLGVRKPGTVTQLGTALYRKTSDVVIKSPFLGIDLSVNDTQGDLYVAQSGERIPIDIEWKNNLSEKVREAELSAQLLGDGFLSQSVSSPKGFYQEADSTVLWDSRNDSSFEEIDADASGNSSFAFTVPDKETLADRGINPRVDINIEMKANRTGGSDEGSSQEILSTAAHNIKVASDLTISADGMYSSGPFQNTGPVPPTAGKKTTYTIQLSLSNTVNKVTGTTVRATLPQYVEWVGKVSPSGENINYNAATGEVAWDVGSVTAGAGYTQGTRKISFQVAFTPTGSQVGSTPDLLRNIQTSGSDAFTNTVIEAEASRLKTNFLENGTVAR